MNNFQFLSIIILMILFAACVPNPRYHSRKSSPKIATVETQTGKPKRIDVYVPEVIKPQEGWSQRGIASFYGKDFHGKLTANGETYDMYAMTSAHKELPLDSWVKVTDLETGKSIQVRINDRGPYIEGRIIDLSFGVAKKLGVVEKGTINVEIEVVEWGDNRYKKQ